MEGMSICVSVCVHMSVCVYVPHLTLEPLICMTSHFVCVLLMTSEWRAKFGGVGTK